MKITLPRGVEIRFNDKRMPSHTKGIVSRRNGSKPTSYLSFGEWWEFFDHLLGKLMEKLKL